MRSDYKSARTENCIKTLVKTSSFIVSNSFALRFKLHQLRIISVCYLQEIPLFKKFFAKSKEKICQNKIKCLPLHPQNKHWMRL